MHILCIINLQNALWIFEEIGNVFVKAPDTTAEILYPRLILRQGGSFLLIYFFSFFFWKSKQWLVKKLLFITYCSLSGSNECGEFNNKEDTIIVHLELNVLKSDLISRCNFKCCHSFVSHCSYISNMHIRLCSILHHVLIAGRWMLLKLYWAEQLSFSRCLVLVTLH